MKFVGAPFTFGFEQVGTNCGLIGKNAAIEIDGVHYAITNGYPDSEGDGTGAGNSAANAGGIALLLELDATDFVVTEASPTIIQYAGSQGNACRITYTTSAAANTRPVLDVTELANC